MRMFPLRDVLLPDCISRFLAVNPDHFDAHNQLGALAYQLKNLKF